MSKEANKMLSHRIIEEMWNTRNSKVNDEIYAAEIGVGHAATKQFMSANLAAFPDLELTIQDQIAENDLVATRYVVHTTHHGEFANIPPRGKSFTTIGIEICRFANGKLVELWNISDMLGALRQLGIIPTV